MISINIAIFGDNNTGKTSLINNFKGIKELSNYETIGIENTSMIHKTEVPICKCICNKVEYLLNFKDVSERHFSFDYFANYLKKEEITICLVLFDFENRTSYDNAKKKIKLLKKKFKSSYFILVGNISDCQSKQVSYQEAYQFSINNKSSFYQANKNRNNIFILYTVLKQIYFDSFKNEIPGFKIILSDKKSFFFKWFHNLWKKN